MVRRKVMKKTVPALIVRQGLIEQVSKERDENLPQSRGVRMPETGYAIVQKFQFCVPYYGLIEINTNDYRNDSSYGKKGFKFYFKNRQRGKLTGAAMRNLFNSELEEWGFNPIFVSLCKKLITHPETKRFFHGRSKWTDFGIDSGWACFDDADIKSACDMLFETAQKYFYDPNNDPRYLSRQVMNSIQNSVATQTNINSYGSDNATKPLNWRGTSWSAPFAGAAGQRFEQIRPILAPEFAALNEQIRELATIQTAEQKKVNEAYHAAKNEALKVVIAQKEKIVEAEMVLKEAIENLLKAEDLA